MSPIQRLLEIYSEYQACSDDDPRKIELLEHFTAEVLKSFQNGDLGGYWAPEHIQQIVHQNWIQQQKK